MSSLSNEAVSHARSAPSMSLPLPIIETHSPLPSSVYSDEEDGDSISDLGLQPVDRTSRSAVLDAPDIRISTDSPPSSLRPALKPKPASATLPMRKLHTMAASHAFNGSPGTGSLGTRNVKFGSTSDWPSKTNSPSAYPTPNYDTIDALLKVMVPGDATTSGERKWEESVEVNACETIGDLKHLLLAKAREKNPSVNKDAYLKSWIYISGSSVVLEDSHPVRFLLWHISPAEALMGNKIIITIYMDPYPQTIEYPEKCGHLLKESGAFRRWTKRFFRLRRGHLSYTKSQEDASQDDKHKSIHLRTRFAFKDHPKNPLQFDIDLMDHKYSFQTLTVQEKEEWRREFNLLAAVNSDVRDQIVADGKLHATNCAKCQKSLRGFRKPHICIDCGYAYCHEHFNKATHRCVDCQAKSDKDKCTLAQTSIRDEQTRQEVLSIFHAAESQELAALEPKQPDSKIVVDDAMLEIHVLQAHDLMASDSNGLSDPYVIIFFEDQQYRTKTIPETLNPVWKEVFDIKVRGAGHSIFVAVFDADKFGKDDFLGCIIIPLTSLKSKVVYDKWYPLHPRPGKYGKADKGVKGEIHLQIQYSFKLTSFLKPVLPSDPKVLSKLEAGIDVEDSEMQPPQPPLSRKTIVANITRASNLIEALHLGDWGNSMQEVLAWKYPHRTLAWFVFYLYMCVYFPSALVPALLPLALLFILITNLIHYQFFQGGLTLDAGSSLPPLIQNKKVELEKKLSSDKDKESLSRTTSIETVEPEEEDLSLDAMVDDLEPEDPEMKDGTGNGKGDKAKQRSPGLFAAARQAQAKMRSIQNAVGDGCTLLEKVQSLMTWRSPYQSAMLCGALVVISILLTIIPMRLLFALIGIQRFTKQLIKRFKGLKAGVKDIEKHMRKDSGNIVLNFVARAPMPWEDRPDERHLPPLLKK